MNYNHISTANFNGKNKIEKVMAERVIKLTLWG